MIGSTIIIPLYADCCGWLLVVAFTLIDVGTDRILLRWLGIRERGLLPRIAMVQTATWLLGMVFEGWMAHSSKRLAPGGFPALIMLVVVAEYSLLRWMTVPGLGSSRLRLGPVHAGLIALLGNLVVVAVVAVPFWLLG